MSDFNLFELFPFEFSFLLDDYEKHFSLWKEMFGKLHNDGEISIMLEDPYFIFRGYGAIYRHDVLVHLIYMVHSNGNTYEFSQWADYSEYSTECYQYSIDIVSNDVASKRIQLLPIDYDCNVIFDRILILTNQDNIIECDWFDFALSKIQIHYRYFIAKGMYESVQFCHEPEWCSSSECQYLHRVDIQYGRKRFVKFLPPSELPHPDDE